MSNSFRSIVYGQTNIRIAVADEVVSDIIQAKIESGKYERHEAATIPRLMIKDEVLLELGAGVGVISALAWATGNVREVHCFEADPRLIALIESTHAQNGVKGVIYNEILSSDERLLREGSMDFFIRQHFYGSSTNKKVGRQVLETRRVAVRSLSEALRRVQPTVIACDIEGGELGLFKNVEMPSVRAVMLETHQSALGGAGMRDVFNDMHNAGFHFDERFSKGSVSVFSRILEQIPATSNPLTK